MIINNLLDKFDKECSIRNSDSISEQYDKIIQIASIVFSSDEFDDLEKRELYQEIVASFGQADKKEK